MELARRRHALWTAVLPRSSPASSAICSGDSPADSARAGALDQERAHLADEVVVVRIRIGDARSEADVRGDHRRVVLRGDAHVVGVAEPADVVADDGAGVARRVEHARPPRVARDGDVEARVECGDGLDDPLELLRLGHLGPRARLHPADVENVGAVGDERVRPPEEGVERERRALVVEGIRRAVEDPHDERARGEIVHAVTEPVARSRPLAVASLHRAAGYANASPRPRGSRRQSPRTRRGRRS